MCCSGSNKQSQSVTRGACAPTAEVREGREMGEAAVVASCTTSGGMALGEERVGRGFGDWRKEG